MKALIIFLLFLVSFVANAQMGMWTWVNGMDTLRSEGNFGIQGVTTSLNSPPSIYEGCEFTDNQGYFWLFGGFARRSDLINGDSNDLWRYDPISNKWTWIKGPGVENHKGHYGVRGVSSPLNLPACRAWGTPSWSDKKGNLWIYGGSIGYDDLWKYNISSNEWTWVKGDTTPLPYQQIAPRYGNYQVLDSGNTPGSRQETAACWTDNDDNLWLFGGASYDPVSHSDAIYNDLWKFDVSLNQWVWMKGSATPADTGYYGIKGVEASLNRPSARFAYAKWKDPDGNFYLMGGSYIDLHDQCVYQGFNDVWKYNITTNNWIWLGGSPSYNQLGSYTTKCDANGSNIPQNYWENRAVCFDGCGNVFMFGGIGSSCSTYTDVTNELWHYNTASNEWSILSENMPKNFGIKRIPSPSNSPPTTFGSLAWYKDGCVWIFGGSEYGNSDSYNCMWQFNLDSTCLPRLCPVSTGIAEAVLIDGFKVYPNPAPDKLHIKTEEKIECLRLYDIAGNLIYQNYKDIKNEIDVSFLSNGLYVAEVCIMGSVMRKKWAKM